MREMRFKERKKSLGCHHSSVDSSAGSSPKHTIYAFIICSICAICHVKRTKINKKRPGLAHLKKKKKEIKKRSDGN